jgi:hypothetical protein
LDGDGRTNGVALTDAMGRVLDQSLTRAQEELELARIELVQKLPVVGAQLLWLVVAAALGFAGLILATLALAWLLGDYVFGVQLVWAGFAVLAGATLIPAAAIAEVVERNRDHLGVFAAWFGFVVGGGVSGVLRLPFRLMRVVLGRPARLEVRMRRDGHSKQLAGALVALATADRQLRRRRGLIWRSIRRTAVVAPAFGAAWVYMVSDEDRFHVLEKTADQVLDRVEHAPVLERVLSP